MYELSRVRLHSVGPKPARYQDITLDLSDVGPVVSQPVQEALFDEDGPQWTPRRPSPATVLFLENGGGKTVLIRLIFSVMLPGRRQVVGTTSTRALEGYVLGGDVAHVALEWQHTKTGQRVVTGKVSGWRGGVVSADPTRLSEAWYSFRPNRTLSIESLPFTQDGRLVTMSGFRDRFTEAHRADPQLQSVWETGHAIWTEHLADLGLDPELFHYQRRMNAGEGEAADAFSFASDEAFVDWLLGAVTSDEDTRTFGDFVEGYATRLAERAVLTAERDFVAGALERLGPLAEAAREASSASSAASRAQREAARFVGAVTARRDTEGQRLTLVTDRARTAAERTSQARAKHQHLERVATELGRRVAELRWKAAVAERETLESERDAARSALNAWGAAEVMLRYDAATEEANQIRAVVGEQEQQAAPALQARDVAARRFARGLLAVAADAEAVAADADERAAELEADLSGAEADEREATRRAIEAASRASAAEDNIASVVSMVDSAVEQGLLSATDDVAVVAEVSAAHALAAAERVGRAHKELSELAGARAVAAETLRDAEREAATLSSAAQAAEERFAAASAVARSLASEDRLAALLGSDSILLDTDTPALLDRLADAIESAESEIMAARIEDAADDRTLAALGSGGLLPPIEDVAAVMRALEDAGITSWSGWQYLASLPADDRARALASHPHLVGGVVLNRVDQLDEARAVLDEARLLPRTIVAVGATDDLRTTRTPLAGFVVPPNPAMFDEELAASEREDILARQQIRRQRTTELAARAAADRRLVSRLHDWQRDYPLGTMERLTVERDSTAAAAADAVDVVADRARIAAETADAEIALREELPALRQSERDTAERARALERLADQVANIPNWQAVARAERDAAQGYDAEAGDYRTRITRVRTAVAELRRKADDHRRTATSARHDLLDVAGGGSVPESEPVPSEPVQTLRAAYASARAAYERVQVGSDLRGELQRVESAESDARVAVDRISSAVRARAAELLSTPDGSDASGRAAATARVERQVADQEARILDAAEAIGRLKPEVKPDTVALEPYGEPADIAHGSDLVTRARADAGAAQAEFRTAESAQSTVEREVAEAQQAVTGFGAIIASLDDVSISDDEPVAFAGGVVEAGERREAVRAALASSRSALSDAEARVRRAADELARSAADDKYDTVKSAVRTQIVKVPRDSLPSYAAEWESALRPRLRSLEDDLAQINRHRGNIVARLRGMVESALTTLRAAQRVSKLPDGLGDWSGQEFLRIRFAEVEQSILDERLADVIDAAVTESDRKKTRRDGLTLLLQGVRAAVGQKGMRVEMLKPDAVLRTERVRVAEISDIFSGGQLLTAAIILYCTMAALRANDRGYTARPHAGVLFLDNPIGRASAGYLLELQLSVAEALGVQLVYTTGLFDTNALDVFPLILRMRNDADLRAGLRYLTVAEEIRNVLPTGAEGGMITATRVYRRPRDPAPAPL